VDGPGWYDVQGHEARENWGVCRVCGLEVVVVGSVVSVYISIVEGNGAYRSGSNGSNGMDGRWQET
jgi:hypothetical protein